MTINFGLGLKIRISNGPIKIMIISEKMLKMLYILQYQVFSQDLTLYVKVNISLSLVREFAFVFNKW